MKTRLCAYYLCTNMLYLLGTGYHLATHSLLQKWSSGRSEMSKFPREYNYIAILTVKLELFTLVNNYAANYVFKVVCFQFINSQTKSS